VSEHAARGFEFYGLNAGRSIGLSCALAHTVGGEMMKNVADYLEVQQLIARYAYALDHRDADAEANCFTREGVHSSPFGAVRGREAIKQAGEKRIASASPTARSRHQIINPWIELDGDRGIVRAYYVGTAVYEDPGVAPTATYGAVRVHTGEYRIEVAKENGEWRFAEREAILDGPPARAT
jgi:hypothetical protein